MGAISIIGLAFNPAKLLTGFVQHLKQPRLLGLFFIDFLLLGSNVALFNYIGFVLTAPPYSLSQSIVGWIFIVQLVDMFSSVYMEKLSNQFGSRKILILSILITLSGVDLTLSEPLWLKVAGLRLTIFGFFGGHSVASSWVERRARLVWGSQHDSCPFVNGSHSRSVNAITTIWCTSP